MSKKRILIVDDEKDLCEVISWDLEDEGFDVTRAHNGKEALEILRTQSFDVTLSDLKMPNGDGVFLLEGIISENLDAGKVFIMSGYADYTEEQLKSLGMVRMYKKPLDVDVFIDDIKDMFDL